MGDIDVFLRRTADGDSVAFASLYDALIPDVHRLVNLMLPDPDVAASVVCDTFIGLWQTASLPGFTGGLTVRAWALADAFRRARDARAA